MKKELKVKTKVKVNQNVKWSNSKGCYGKKILVGYVDKEELQAYKEGILETVIISHTKEEALAISMNKKIKKVYIYEK